MKMYILTACLAAFSSNLFAGEVDDFLKELNEVRRDIAAGAEENSVLENDVNRLTEKFRTQQKKLSELSHRKHEERVRLALHRDFNRYKDEFRTINQRLIEIQKAVREDPYFLALKLSLSPTTFSSWTLANFEKKSPEFLADAMRVRSNASEISEWSHAVVHRSDAVAVKFPQLFSHYQTINKKLKSAHLENDIEKLRSLVPDVAQIKESFSALIVETRRVSEGTYAATTLYSRYLATVIFAENQQVLSNSIDDAMVYENLLGIQNAFLSYFIVVNHEIPKANYYRVEQMIDGAEAFKQIVADLITPVLSTTPKQRQQLVAFKAFFDIKISGLRKRIGKTPRHKWLDQKVAWLKRRDVYINAYKNLLSKKELVYQEKGRALLTFFETLRKKTASIPILLLSLERSENNFSQAISLIRERQ